MPVQLRTLEGKVPKDVELQIRNLVSAVNQLESRIATLEAKVKQKE